MKKIPYVFVVLSIFLLSLTTDKQAYQLFDVSGKKTTYEKMMKDILSCDIVLFGELHNNPISHWLELQVGKDLFRAKKQDLVLGAEMFEADNQELINDYLKGKIVEDTFRSKARFWSNYETDYRPLVEFARNTNIPFIATNIPRKYAAMVNRDGFDPLNSLSETEKQYVAPLPVEYDPELEQYKKMLEMNMGGHASPNLPKAQAIKDATMAYFILKNRLEGKIFLHFNGTYHSDYFEGIMWYLKRKDPDLKVLTIASVEQSDLSKLSPDYIMLADYIICIPDDMTKTY